MKKLPLIVASLALLALGGIAQASVSIDTVVVGNQGNAADITGFGKVDYVYSVGKYEVTAGQYTEFLNSKAKYAGDPYGLYNVLMADTTSLAWGCNILRSGNGTTASPYVYSVAANWANRPVNYVSYWDSLRFANWLSNGQGNGSTETGAYTLTAGGIAANTIARNPGAIWAVTSENEWYKAAYYDPGKNGGAGYWLYTTRSNSIPANQVMSTDPGNSANYYFYNYSIGSPYYRTNVGEFENSSSAYGTFDQGGNVWEWNESILNGADRGLRGASFYNNDFYLRATSRYNVPSISETYNFGFRVSNLAEVPEPSSSLLALTALLTPVLSLRRRKG